MAQTRMSKADRFFSNPVLRDQEWERATQPPWLLMIVSLAIIAVGAFAGVYGDKPINILGWIVLVVTIVVYSLLARVRRSRARRQLREAHGQPGG